MNKAYALKQLYENRLLRNQAEADLFRAASTSLLELPPEQLDSSDLDQLYACFDDRAVLSDLAWEVLQLVEGSDDDGGGLLRAAAGLSATAPGWFEILLRRTLNDSTARAALMVASKAVDGETQRLLAAVAERIAHGTESGAPFGDLLLQSLRKL